MFRIGHGYDSHRFETGRELILGGLRIAHTHGLAGHSDADAVLHALTDAILGAIAAGDIGQHFPDSDPQWADADSATFVRHAMRLAGLTGMSVANCDITVITEAPRLGAHRKAMRQNIAELLGVDISAVNVKATTNEGMGAIGRREGLAATAVVLLQSQ